MGCRRDVVADPACWTLDGLGGVLLADEDLEQAQFGFDAFIFLVLVQHGHTVLLLYIPIGRAEGRGGKKKERKKGREGGR